MKIAIHSGRLGLATQDRAYVEYRLFSAISQFARACGRLRVRLDEIEGRGTGTRYRCSVDLGLKPAGRIRVRATGDRLYAAIDAAAERLARGVEGHLTRENSSSTGGQVPMFAATQIEGRVDDDAP